jgi:hypothetical protein
MRGLAFFGRYLVRRAKNYREKPGPRKGVGSLRFNSLPLFIKSKSRD